jgi:hypothetical protein
LDAHVVFQEKRQIGGYHQLRRSPQDLTFAISAKDPVVARFETGNALLRVVTWRRFDTSAEWTAALDE